MSIEEKCRKELGCNTEYIENIIQDMCFAGGPISIDYSMGIIHKVIGYVVQDIIDCADHEDWNQDDVKLAFSRALVHKLKVII